MRPVFSSKIIAPNREPAVFRNELRGRVRTSHGEVRFFVGKGQRLTLAYVEYVSPLCFACAPFLAPKSLRQIGNLWFFGTNSGSVCEPLMGGVLCGERSGDRSIGEANLRKGRQPLLWKRHCRPLQWPAHLAPGWRASRLASALSSALSSVLRLRGNSKYVQNCMILRFVENIFELRAKFKSLFRRV